jgi:hypothetical protein
MAASVAARPVTIAATFAAVFIYDQFSMVMFGT